MKRLRDPLPLLVFAALGAALGRGGRRWLGSGASALVVALLALPLALAQAPRAADPVLEAHLRALASELRCLACQNQTLADSHAPLAEDLRAQMRAMLRAGTSDDDIRAFLTSRYGDVVRYRPPLLATGVALRWGPALLVLAGLGWLALTLRRRAQLPGVRFEPDPKHVPEPAP
jgi:cytochrome c-type biogenesis protein CcmH